MEYILFDDCYMSSLEVAYDLRHVTRHLIACPTEIMVYGMPYSHIGEIPTTAPSVRPSINSTPTTRLPTVPLP